MTGDDFSDLAALWNAPPRKEEQRELERLARRTPRMARAVQWGELVTAGAIVFAIVGAIIVNLSTASVLTGSLILLLLGWSAWKRHQFTNQSLLIDDHDRITFLTSSLRAKEAEIRRSALGLSLMVPGTLLMILLYFSLHHGEGEGDVMAFLGRALSTSTGQVTVAIIAGAVLLLGRAHMGLIAEAARLRALRDDYAVEARQDRLDAL